MAKTASNQLGICLRIMHVQRMPKVSIFMAVTTKIVPEKAQKWPKMARFWPKWRYNGRVMAREVFFYQCLWVTKLCAKFGCSRTLRTASIHKFLQFYGVCERSQPLCNQLDHHYIHFSILRENLSVLLETINTQTNLKQVPPSKLVQRRLISANIMQ